MDQITAFLSDAERFSSLTATADADWDAPSPCEGWTAGDVVDHVVDSQRDFLAQRGADLGERPPGPPDGRWAAHLTAVRGVLGDEAFASSEYDGFFGRTTVADSMARFYGFDLLVHHWDLARALGSDVTWDEEQMDRIEGALDGFGDNLYLEGVCRPALDAPEDAPRQVRLLARMGRRA